MTVQELITILESEADPNSEIVVDSDYWGSDVRINHIIFESTKTTLFVRLDGT